MDENAADMAKMQLFIAVGHACGYNGTFWKGWPPNAIVCHLNSPFKVLIVPICVPHMMIN